MAVILPELGPLADFKFPRMAHSPCESSFLSFPLRNKFSGAMMAGPYENSTCICSIFLALRFCLWPRLQRVKRMKDASTLQMDMRPIIIACTAAAVLFANSVALRNGTQAMKV